MPNARYAVREDCPQDIVDDLIDNLPNLCGERRDARDACSRHDFARFAANIARDRYSAGSLAAKLTIIILLKFGTEAALDFAADLTHHED